MPRAEIKCERCSNEADLEDEVLCSYCVSGDLFDDWCAGELTD